MNQSPHRHTHTFNLIPHHNFNPLEFICILLLRLIALDAVQAFSLGSNQAQNPLEIDDVEIANNIAMCANDNQAAESYGYKWAWEDGEIQEQEVRSKLDDFRRRKIEGFRVSYFVDEALSHY